MGRESTQAAKGLWSAPVRTILAKQIVAPLLDSPWKVAAFRMHWNKHPDSTVQNIWNQISQARAILDELVCQLDGIVYVISAINATTNSLPSGQRRVRAGVYYWVVSKTAFDCRALTEHMESNTVGAAVKLQLQPFQTTEKDFCTTLYNAVKDNMGGCVRRMVEESSPPQVKEAVVKVYITNKGPTGLLRKALSDLHNVRFYAELYEI